MKNTSLVSKDLMAGETCSGCTTSYAGNTKSSSKGFSTDAIHGAGGRVQVESCATEYEGGKQFMLQDRYWKNTFGCGSMETMASGCLLTCSL